jgi:RHS repeat-associated protein
MLQDPKGGVVYYSYDQRGLVTRVDSAAGSTYYTHDARGALLSRRLPNGTVTYHTYDAAGRLATLENRKGGGSAISTFEFTRDANGNITRSLREDGSCWYYDYDGLQRLHKAEWKDAGGATLYAFTYNYDKVGNRTSLLAGGQVTCYSYNAANELIKELCDGQTVSYAYDGRGNCIRRTVEGGHTTYFAYNSRNLLTAITSTDPAFTPNAFEYNALGQRIKKVDSTGTTRYIWDGLNIVLELDAAGNLRRRYTHGYAAIEGVSSLIDVEDAGSSHYFYHFDQVGGVRQLTDAYQNTGKSYEYGPFGRLLVESGTAPNDSGFPGTYLILPDLEDLRLSPTRLYDAKLGRFLQRDLLDQDDAASLRGYAMSFPVNRTDPLGTAPILPHAGSLTGLLAGLPLPGTERAGETCLSFCLGGPRRTWEGTVRVGGLFRPGIVDPGNWRVARTWTPDGCREVPCGLGAQISAVRTPCQCTELELILFLWRSRPRCPLAHVWWFVFGKPMRYRIVSFHVICRRIPGDVLGPAPDPLDPPVTWKTRRGSGEVWLFILDPMLHLAFAYPGAYGSWKRGRAQLVVRCFCCQREAGDP